ncbi:MAG: LON peptidase substrate-binding domain-containing protein [Bacteroidota bacterium]|nr:LON peptidase substrate-binding domain-containing protein [Bacteroidota bacterium]
MPLPMLPLRLLPMPGEIVGLHIFEQRYQVLFNDLEAMHVDEFGIPFFHDSKIWRVGAKMRLVNVQKRHSGGKRDVAVTATGLFRLKNMDEAPGVVPYPLGEVEDIQEWPNWPLGKACTDARDALIQDMKTYDMYVGNLENQGLVRLIQHLGIDARQRADILSKASIQEMQQSLLERIEVTRRLIQQSPQDGSSFFVN